MVVSAVMVVVMVALAETIHAYGLFYYFAAAEMDSNLVVHGSKKPSCLEGFLFPCLFHKFKFIYIYIIGKAE